MSGSFQNIRLLVTDFDGTIFDNRGDFSAMTDFRNLVSELRANGGMLWTVCTGRGLRSLVRASFALKTMEIRCDFLITRHKFIYEVGKTLYMPHILWALHIDLVMRKDLHRIGNLLVEWESLLKAGSGGSRTIKLEKDRLLVRFNSVPTAVSAENMIRDAMRGERHLRIFRRGTDLDIGVIPYTKGLAVSELARNIGISPDGILAIGNGYNDISMLDRKVASGTGCPLNADPDVMKQVHRMGGHIARKESLAGTIEIIRAYMSGAVNSDFPAGWNEKEENPDALSGYRPHRDRERHHHGPRLNIWLLLATVYTVLAVFANYGFIPSSRAVMFPLRLAIKLAVAVLEKARLLF